MYVLRDYQQQAADTGVDYFLDKKQTKPVLAIIPTAGGKSHVMADIACRLDAPTLIFQPTKEILLQNYNKLIGTGAMGVTIYSASMKSKEIGNITLATIGSVYNNLNNFKSFKYIIIDECHLFSAKPSMYRSFFDAVGSKMIGFSATPWRQSTDGYGGTIMKFLTRTNPRVFSKVIHVTQIKELLDAGYLAKTEYYSINGFNRSEIKLNSTGADYDEASERMYYDNIRYKDRILKVVNRLLSIGKTKIIVFTKFVKESEELSVALGDIACHVSSSMPTETRDSNFKGFKNGKYKVLFNVGITKLGYDFPELEVEVDTCPTRSLTNWMQKGGRVMRTHPNKKSGWIVDMCNNIETFGKIEDMEIVQRGGDNLWCVMSKGKQLTNVYLDEIMKD